MRQPGGWRVRAYLRARRTFDASLSMVQACFDGVWLGVLDREHLHAVDQRYYDTDRRYTATAYNEGGLHAWEQKVVAAHFAPCKRIAVIGAGAGREMIALRRAGFEVDGFECNPALRARGQDLLRTLDITARLASMPRDRWPPDGDRYDGVIVGWGTYMLIGERRQRIDLLRAARSTMPVLGPILVSFFARTGRTRYLRVTSGLANVLRWVRCRPPVEFGASLAPNRVQFFTLDEIAKELEEAGFSIAHISADGYGHAVGLALHEPPAPPGATRSGARQFVDAAASTGVV